MLLGVELRVVVVELPEELLLLGVALRVVELFEGCVALRAVELFEGVWVAGVFELRVVSVWVPLLRP